MKNQNLYSLLFSRKYKVVMAIVWGISVVILTLLWIDEAYDNGMKRHIENKIYTKQSLCNVAELVVNHEFDKLGIPYSVSGGSVPRTTRRAINEKGTFDVRIDSLKERQSLYSLKHIGLKAYSLVDFGDFPLDMLMDSWRGYIGKQYKNVECALRLHISPLGETDVQSYQTVGDTAICSSKNELGVYYLDDLYTLKLTVYYLPPTLLRCINWSDTFLLAIFLLWIAILGIPILLALLRRHRYSIEQNAISKTVFQIGEYTLDLIKHTLTYQNIEEPCSLQAGKLLHAFVEAPDYFLTNEEISIVCGWPLDDISLDERRRTAISSLRRIFKGRVVFQSIREKKGYQMIVSPEI